MKLVRSLTTKDLVCSSSGICFGNRTTISRFYALVYGEIVNMGSNPLQTTKKIEKRFGRLKKLSYLCQTKNKNGACFNSDILRSVRLVDVY